MKDLTGRIFVAAVSVAVLLCLIVFALHPLFQYAVALVVALLAAVAVWEYGKLALVKGGQIILPILMGQAIFQVFSFFLASLFPSLVSLPLLIFLLSTITLFALHFRQTEGAVVDLALSSFALLYIAIPMGMTLGILYFNSGQDGRLWVAYLLVVTKIADVGAYFGGNLWGKMKLAPRISPGKTIEGAVLGLFCSLGVSCGFYALSRFFASNLFDLNLIESILLGLLLGCVGQFGDLSESLLKRDANKKDSNALPGLGGVLDSIDSLLFNAPIIYIYLTYFKI